MKEIIETKAPQIPQRAIAQRDPATGETKVLLPSDADINSTLGTTDPSLTNHLIELSRLTAQRGTDPADSMNQALAFIASVEPKDAIETMIAQQMHAVHNHALYSFGLASAAGTHQIKERHINQAAKLSGLFTRLTEVLDRRRGKGGGQRVVVEHVTVNSGGQAVVGAVNHGGAGSYA